MISDYFYTLKQTAEVLGLSSVYVWMWAKQGRIHGQKIGREVLFPKWEIDFIKEERQWKKEERQRKRGQTRQSAPRAKRNRSLP